jgi:hypothetical protein
MQFQKTRHSFSMNSPTVPRAPAVLPRFFRRSVLLLALPFVIGSASAQSVTNFALQVSAVVQTNPPQITLVWPAVDGVTGYAVSRKSKDDTSWGSALSLPPSSSSYTDSNVEIGNSFEYHVLRTGTNFDSHAYIYAGIESPLVESRGKVLLIVDHTFSGGLAAELARLQQDLVGDGWQVIRHDVPRMSTDPANLDPAVWVARSNELASVKGVIQEDYRADPTNVRAVLLFGHVPVPYAGNLAPDQHPDHLGAWPADAYYGDMTGIWTDASVVSTNAVDRRNQNVIGDGKLDQSYIPAPEALQVGRVDLANLPLLPTNEQELLRQYLNKDHNFRNKIKTAQARGLVDDNFGDLGDIEVPAVNGWNNLAALVGPGQATSGRWLTELTQSDYLWSYGCGAGTYTGAVGVADTTHFLVYDFKVVFTMLFGSYFGDWDSPNNFLRATLAGSSYTLASVWVDRPNWYFHHMALGETIGFSTRVSQNNSGLYLPNYKTHRVLIGPGYNSFLNQVHISLMGDPTLRQQPVAPPGLVTAGTNTAGNVVLTWGASSDDVLGYYVYRASGSAGPYSRITSSLLTGTNYVDPEISSDSFYMVRAVRLESSPSGTYLNPSQGAFAQALLTVTTGNGSIWTGRGLGTWTINDATGTAGAAQGWDSLVIQGNLYVVATSSNQFTVRIISFDSNNTLGPPAHFDNNQSYSWPIVTTSAGAQGFDPSKINLLTSEFQGDLGGGAFSLAVSGDGKSINLVFTPNHPPATRPAAYSRPWDTPLLVPISDLLSQFTTDPDGDNRALVQVGTSTNGTTIATDGTNLVFTPTINLKETIPYWISDVRPYRPGDTVRITAGTITIVPIPVPLPFSAYHAIEIEWQGDPGVLYQLQSREDTSSDWVNQGNPFLGTGQKQSVFERTTNPNKFYRIILLQ